MKNCIIVLALIFIILSFSACKKTEQPQKPSKTIVVLIDYSESVKDARQDYSDAFKKILPKIKLGDYLFLWKITELSEMEPKPLIDEDFPIPLQGKNEYYTKRAIEEAEKEMKMKLDSIGKKVDIFLNSQEQLSKKTAILGSLQIAEKVFKKDRKDKALLVIMSDMIEDSSEYNFETEKLSDKRISEIIANEKRRGRLPDLNGVEVYVVGAKAPSREQFYNIQNFWLRYFKECGANLSKENYGSALLSFNE